MERSDMILVEEGEKSRCRNFCSNKKTLIYKLFKPFGVAPERKVKRPEFTAKDFELPEECWVAKYDPKRVAKYWNYRNLPRSLAKTIADSFFKGIAVKLIPIVILFLFMYYVLNPFVFNRNLCEPANENITSGNQANQGRNHQANQGRNHQGTRSKTSSKNSNPRNQRNPADNGNSHGSPSEKDREGYVKMALSFLTVNGHEAWCHKAKFMSWKKMEQNFTKVLTLFIGFLVSLSVRNWFLQVKMVPQLDSVLIQMNHFVWVDTSKNPNDFKVKIGLTPNEFRKTIVRYFLLSWTMCMSRMCNKMNSTLGNQYAMNEKSLLLKREFDELNYPAMGKTWREKWSSPLSWVGKMANDPKLKDQEALKVLDVKDAIGKSLNAYCDKLQQLNSFNQFRIPAPLLSLLTIAIYVFLILSVISGQDMYPGSHFANGSNGNVSAAMVIFFDFPWFAITKYLLIFGWLKVATDLMVPFGNKQYER